MLTEIPRSQPAQRFYETFFRWRRAQHTATRLCGSGRENTLQPGHHQQRAQLVPPGEWRHERRVSIGAVHRRPESTQSMARSEARLGLSTSNINVQADIATHVRHAMRRIPHPVAVITSAAPTEPEDAPEAAFRGMTVSSFNTVTLDPTPLVSFNVRAPSATHSAMSASGSFLAHLLAASESGASIAHAFSKGGNSQGEAFQSLAQEGDAVRIYSGLKTAGAPLLAGSGVLQVLRCRILQGKDVEIGDHRIVVAEVVSVMARPGGEDAAAPEKMMGLSYCDRGYRTMGAAIDPEARRSRSANEPIQRTMGLNLRQGDESGR